jgi:two-component system chemotaxis response regulator CheB
MAPPLRVSNDFTDKSSAVAIIGSAGAIPALSELLAWLPATFPFPIIVAQHLSPDSPSVLPAILARRSRLAVKWAEPGEMPLGGVYLVPRGHQLVIGANGFAISRLAPLARSWLACPDALLLSLAQWYGAAAIGIVLSGALAAGIAGIRAILACGGIVLAQNEISSSHFEMPVGAIDLGKAELVLSPTRMAEVLLMLADEREQPPRGGGSSYSGKSPVPSPAYRLD